MFSRQQQYEQHMGSFRPGVRPGGANMGGGPGGMVRPGYMQQRMLTPRYPPHQQHPAMQNMDPMTRMGMQQRMPGMDPNMQQRMPGMDPNMQQRMPGMDPNMQQRMPGMDPSMQQRMPGMDPNMQQRMPGLDPSMQQRMPGMDPRMHHPNMGMNQVNHPGMMRPMGAGHMPGYPGHSAPGNSMPGTNMAAANPNHNNMANPATTVMNKVGVMPPNISPGSMHPAHPSRSPQMPDRQIFQNSQYRMSSPQYQGQHSSYSNSPTYPGTPNAQGYPPTPGAYPQPLTPGGHQKPPTPQGVANPPTPQSALQNPLTPGSYPAPSTPGSYPNPTTPVSYQNPLTPQPQESPVAQPHPHNADMKLASSQHPNMPQHQPPFNAPKSESVIQSAPIQNIFKDASKMTNPMLSPPSSVLTSDLRKIRRPSKSVTPGTVSPNQKNLSPTQIKTEIKPDPDSLDIKKEAPSPFVSAPDLPAPVIKTEPVIPKVEKPESPKPPPPPPKTPDPPKEPRWGEDGPDGMPEKALQKVFQYVCYSQGCLPFLLNAMKICKLWCKVAKEPSLWTHANLGNKIKEKARTEKNLEYILKNKFPNAVEVDVCNWRAAISSPALKIIAANCPNLRGLGLSQCVKLSHEDVRIIPSLFPNLQKVDVSCVAVSFSGRIKLSHSKVVNDFLSININYFSANNSELSQRGFKHLPLGPDHCHWGQADTLQHVKQQDGGLAIRVQSHRGEYHYCLTC